MQHLRLLLLIFAVSLAGACADKPATDSSTKNQPPSTAVQSDNIEDKSADNKSATVATEQEAGETVEEETVNDPPPALTQYKGREIARTMHWTGGPWLLRATREQEERTSRVMTELQLKPGMTVADVGCGNGYYTLKLAKAVAGDQPENQQGKIYGVEIQEEYFGQLRQRAADADIKNIELIIGEVHDPNLPPESCDLIILVDVYHEFSHPEHMLKNMRKALKPNGTLALLEFRSEDLRVPIKTEHKMSKDQIMKELEPNGYKLVREFNDLPWQHLMFFARDDSPLEAIKPTPNDGGYAEAVKRREQDNGRE